LGMESVHGNYSASEHGLGYDVLSATSKSTVCDLARDLLACKRAVDIPSTIYSKALPYLKISVGSEMAMMLRPEFCVVANVRTLWSHLLVKHNFDYDIADEACQLYRDHDRTSEMDYKTWAAQYPDILASMTKLHALGVQEAANQGKVAGRFFY